jgi:hypothetical protein
MDLQKKGRCDHMYQKAQEIEGRTSKTLRMFEIEDNQGNTDHRGALKIWKKMFI